MGQLHSRRSPEDDESNAGGNGSQNRSVHEFGNYFGNHFILGGERFDTNHPEGFLFGNTNDLRYLGNRGPTPFPYRVPKSSEPNKALRSLIHVRKDSLKLCKQEQIDDSADERYHLEFVFDADVRCAIRIYYIANEKIDNGNVVYDSKKPEWESHEFYYEKGSNQLFSQPEHSVIPSKIDNKDLILNPSCNDKRNLVYPIVIQIDSNDNKDFVNHSHVTLATFEKLQAGSYGVKPLKQKQMVDGIWFIIQEIYGIENKNVENSGASGNTAGEDMEDDSTHCVICMSKEKNTLILPCRHLCLCSGCAESLRFQSSNCPICRSPFRALLGIQAFRYKKDAKSKQKLRNHNGFEPSALMEILNGTKSDKSKGTESITSQANKIAATKHLTSSVARSARQHGSKDKEGTNLQDESAATSNSVRNGVNSDTLETNIPDLSRSVSKISITVPLTEKYSNNDEQTSGSSVKQTRKTGSSNRLSPTRNGKVKSKYRTDIVKANENRRKGKSQEILSRRHSADAKLGETELNRPSSRLREALAPLDDACTDGDAFYAESSTQKDENEKAFAQSTIVTIHDPSRLCDDGEDNNCSTRCTSVAGSMIDSISNGTADTASISSNSTLQSNHHNSQRAVSAPCRSRSLKIKVHSRNCRDHSEV